MDRMSVLRTCLANRGRKRRSEASVMIAVWYSGLGWILVGAIFVTGVIHYLIEKDK